MEYTENGGYGAQNREFIGKRGERLALSGSTLTLSTNTSVYVLRLSSISGFYCEKRRSYYDVRIFSDAQEAMSTDARSSRCLITLKTEDAQRLIDVLKNLIVG